jgi:hypothetical protein
MYAGNCGCGKKLCPVSFGLALGLVVGLAMLLESLWVMYYGPSTMMTQLRIPVPTFDVAAINAFWGLVKGFVFGFFLALFYDLISCCCKMRCCKSNCACCVPGNNNKSDINRPDTLVK